MTITALTNGKAFDLANPDPALIDFTEIARVLAQINRYGGRTRRPVSVALHTLIGATMADAAVLPYWLLHDAHEAYVGDMQTPVKHALDMQSSEVRTEWNALTHRIDRAIWTAAGLRPPGPKAVTAIHVIDYNCMHIERHHMLAAPKFDWVIPAYTGLDAALETDWATEFRDAAAHLEICFRAILPVFLQERLTRLRDQRLLEIALPHPRTEPL